MPPSDQASSARRPSRDLEDASDPSSSCVMTVAAESMDQEPRTQTPGAAEAELPHDVGGLSAVSVGHKQGSGDDLIDLSDDGSKRQESSHDDGHTGDATDMARPRSPADDHLASSVATLKPTIPAGTTATTTQYLAAPPSSTYIDPTPPTPLTSPPSSRTPSNAPRSRHAASAAETSPSRSDAAFDEKRYMSEDDQENGPRSEIQSIMEQFSEGGGGPDAQEVMSPRLEMTSPHLGSPAHHHPPRKSSLEPLSPNLAQQIHEFQGLRASSSSPPGGRSKSKEQDDKGPPVPPKDHGPGLSLEERQVNMENPL